MVDAGNNRTEFGYDALGRLLKVTDAAGNVTRYGYDTENNLTSITDALKRTTSFSYGEQGRVAQTVFPSQLSESYTYDAAGNLLTKKDRKGQTISYSYDVMGRLTSKSTGVSYTYDLVGRLLKASDATGTYGFSYDNLGRLTGTTTSYSFLEGKTFTNSYAYDAASNRTSYTDPAGSTSTYTYDGLNRLTDITNSWAGHFGFSYDSLSRRTALTRPNGVNTTYGYNNLSQLLSVLHGAETNPADGAKYGYDGAGNRKSKQNLGNGVNESYGYDDLYQLTQVTQTVNGADSTSEKYSYDAVGNRLSSLGLSPWTFNSSNQLLSTPDSSFSYDNNGNLTSKTQGSVTTEYSWDIENRLTQVTKSDGTTVNFRYDPFGRRVQKSSSSGTVNYVYDGANMVAEYDSAGNSLGQYTQGAGIDEPLAVQRGGTMGYYHADGLGSITSLTGTDGTVLNQYVYDSFGRKTSAAEGGGNPFQYTGREWDQETGLYYYRARYYDPPTGRFLSEDPLAFGGGMNFYAYVHNSPSNLVDPYGLKDDASPWQVGWEWLTGSGPHAHFFTDGDPFTEKLRQHQHIQDLINDVCNGTLASSGHFNYRLNGVKGVPKYLRDYSTLFTGGATGNIAVTYLGTYGLDYTVTSGTLNIHVWNLSTISSATHPPVLGYTGAWKNNIGDPLDRLIESGPLGEPFGRAPMSQTYQAFDFHENLNSRCGCKAK